MTHVSTKMKKYEVAIFENKHARSNVLIMADFSNVLTDI